jgi:hypothetical protein
MNYEKILVVKLQGKNFSDVENTFKSQSATGIILQITIIA